MATQYEQRVINGSTYTVPVGLRSDWQPGQAYNLSTLPGNTTSTTPTPTASLPTLYDWGKNNGLDIGWDNGQITFTKNGQTKSASTLNGLTFDSGQNRNLVSNPSVLNTSIAELFGNSKANTGKAQEATDNVSQLKNWVNQNSGQQAATSNNDFAATYNQMYSQLQSMLQGLQPSAQTPDLQGQIASLRTLLSPQQEITKTKIAQARDDALKQVMNNLAKRGGGLESSEADEQVAKLFANTENAQSLADAEFEATLANMANTNYQNAISNQTSAQNAYIQASSNLGMQFLSGAVDLARFLMDDAYRNAVLSKDYTEMYLNYGGEVA